MLGYKALSSQQNSLSPKHPSPANRVTALFERIELARLVKLYVKSLYGADSPQFKQISGLRFTKPRGL